MLSSCVLLLFGKRVPPGGTVWCRVKAAIGMAEFMEREGGARMGDTPKAARERFIDFH
jgi:hypothetical protein